MPNPSLPTRAYAAKNASSVLAPFEFGRREPGENDVLITIAYCGVCHSDIHQVRDEWGGAIYPMVPGHEIVGKVARVGKNVKNFKPGDLAGVGCFVDSCRVCHNCSEGLEQYCDQGMTGTYNSLERDGKTPTYGGYSSQITVDEKYTLKIPANLSLETVAPLLCAGITTYSPLKHWGAGPGHKIAVMGLGGLGHMAVKLAASMGAEVSVLSTSKSKEKDAKRLGAQDFFETSNPQNFKKLGNHFDLIINTVSAPHDLNQYLSLLNTNGTMVLLGVPPKAPEVQTFQLIGRRRSLAGSLIGGIRETQEMLNYCGSKSLGADVEVIAMKDINTAYERMLKGDVKYRFSIDMATL